MGADLIVAFDDHESAKHSKEETINSLELTEKWALRSLKEHNKKKGEKPLLYGVIHGGVYQDLRIRSAKFTDENFEAIAIGGIYGDKKILCQIVEWVAGQVSEEKPKHLLGIGEVEDLFNGVERGIDFFDCAAPTRRARFGSLYLSPKNGGRKANSFTLSIRQSKYTADKKPIDQGCACYTCSNFSRAYLRHLMMAREILYHELATYHNIYFITNLVARMRNAILIGEFHKFKEDYLRK